jgi:uncharacterized membrane protein
MFITFLTVLATIWVVVYVIGTLLTFVEFYRLTPAQQFKARITFDPLGFTAFLVCVAWLIARALS